jgi:Protein of unknown function (DUF1631)
MITSPQALSAAYEACLSEAIRQSPLVIRRWSTKLMDALYERAKVLPENAEKRQVLDAIASLKKNQPLIEREFPVALTQEIAEETGAAPPGSAGSSSRSFSSLSFDELELMGDNQVQETVETARLQQVVSMSCESGLAGLSARVSTAQGLKTVKAEKNPLRPEIVCCALMTVLQEVPADNEARMRWLTQGSLLLGVELQALYVELTDQLAAMGVAPAAYNVIPSAAPRAGRGGAEADGQGAGAGMADVGAQPGGTGDDPGEADILTLDHLHSLVVGDLDASFNDSALPSDFGLAAQKGFSHTVPAAMEALADLKKQGLSSAVARKAAGAAAPSVAQLRIQLRAQAKSLGQSLAVEVVGLMIGQIANDHRLLPPVRALLAGAEPAFLRLGVSDPRFFSNKAHPARRLLELITAKSLAFASETAPGFAGFMEDLREVAAGLEDENAGDAQHFFALLQVFEGRIAARNPDNSVSQGRAVQALLMAEQRNLLADRIAAEIRERPDFTAGNRVITGFVTGPWAQVMAKERLLGEHGGLGSQKAVYSLTLGDLLWSIDTAQAARHRQRLVKIIPAMLQSLRDGLLSIDYPLAQSKPFFDELMTIHQAALKTDPPLDDKARIRQALDKAFDDVDHAGGSHRAWLAPGEAQDSGFMDDLATDTKPGFQATQPHTREDGQARPAAAPASIRLRLGAWVELLHDDQWVRAQLTWISPYNTLFLFTSDGGRTHSMTGPLLQYLLLQEQVRVISQQGVVDGALDSVARTAMRNSVSGHSQH